MKMTGIIRKIDDLGRVVLPIEHRRFLEISEKDSLEIFMEGDRIVLKKHQEACIFCGNTENVTDYMGKNICGDCIQKVGALE